MTGIAYFTLEKKTWSPSLLTSDFARHGLIMA